MYVDLPILMLLLLPLPHLVLLLFDRYHHHRPKLPPVTLIGSHVPLQHLDGYKGVCTGLLRTSWFSYPSSLFPLSKPLGTSGLTRQAWESSGPTLLLLVVSLKQRVLLLIIAIFSFYVYYSGLVIFFILVFVELFSSASKGSPLLN